jgi:hypothetical protein
MIFQIFEELFAATDGMRYQYRTVPYRLVSVRDGIGKKEVGRDGTVRYAVLDSYTALPCCHKKNNLLTMISDNIYLISLFALDVNRNPTKITRINYLSISYSRLFHFNFV